MENNKFDLDWYKDEWPEEKPKLNQFGPREDFIHDILTNFKDIDIDELIDIVGVRCFETGEDEEELINEIEDRCSELVMSEHPVVNQEEVDFIDSLEDELLSGEEVVEESLSQDLESDIRFVAKTCGIDYKLMSDLIAEYEDTHEHPEFKGSILYSEKLWDDFIVWAKEEKGFDLKEAYSGKAEVEETYNKAVDLLNATKAESVIYGYSNRGEFYALKDFIVCKTDRELRLATDLVISKFRPTGTVRVVYKGSCEKMMEDLEKETSDIVTKEDIYDLFWNNELEELTYTRGDGLDDIIVEYEGGEIPYSWDSLSDRIIYKDIPSAYGYLKRYTYFVKASEEIELIQKYLKKALDEITYQDLESIDTDDFTAFVLDELEVSANEEAADMVAHGDYDSDRDVEWVESEPPEYDEY